MGLRNLYARTTEARETPTSSRLLSIGVLISGTRRSPASVQTPPPSGRIQLSGTVARPTEEGLPLV